MKKTLLSILALTCGTYLLADIPLPTYVPALHGKLVQDLARTSRFELEPGQLQKCERRAAGDWVLYTCTVEGAHATITNERGLVRNYTFSKVYIDFHHYSSGFINAYTFSGNWSQISEPVSISSRVVLLLSHPRKDASLLKGSLELPEFDIVRAVIATPK